jgi:hypothetical protein
MHSWPYAYSVPSLAKFDFPLIPRNCWLNCIFLYTTWSLYVILSSHTLFCYIFHLSSSLHPLNHQGGVRVTLLTCVGEETGSNHGRENDYFMAFSVPPVKCLDSTWNRQRQLLFSSCHTTHSNVRRYVTWTLRVFWVKEWADCKYFLPLNLSRILTLSIYLLFCSKGISILRVFRMDFPWILAVLWMEYSWKNIMEKRKNSGSVFPINYLFSFPISTL